MISDLLALIVIQKYFISLEQLFQKSRQNKMNEFIYGQDSLEEISEGDVLVVEINSFPFGKKQVKERVHNVARTLNGELGTLNTVYLESPKLFFKEDKLYGVTRNGYDGESYKFRHETKIPFLPGTIGYWNIDRLRDFQSAQLNN